MGLVSGTGHQGGFITGVFHGGFLKTVNASRSQSSIPSMWLGMSMFVREEKGRSHANELCHVQALFSEPSMVSAWSGLLWSMHEEWP